MTTKTIMVTICGRPNVGKSTITNALVGEKIAIVSDKPQTTRNRITAIVNRGDTQFILMDTPGFHKPRTRLGDYMVNVVRESVADVDAIVMMVEPTEQIGRQEEELIKRLKGSRVPVILAINKIDTLTDKTQLLTYIDAWKQQADFAAIVPVSAVTGDGLEELLTELKKFTFPSPHFFPADATSDQTEQALAAEVIREKMLLLLRQEIPHGIAVDIERMGERETEKGTILDVEAYIYCERDSHKGMVIGKKGAMLKEIASQARTELEELFGTKVNLQCWVKVKEDWRNRQGFLNGLGYRLD